MKVTNSNKSFGIVFFIFFTILFLFQYFNSSSLNFTLIFIALTFLFLGIINSKLLTPLNKIWIKFGEVLGKIVAPIVMFIVYFGAVFLTKIFLYIFNKDIINLKKSNKLKSYWINRKDKLQSMDNQF
jgi:hypothetical protein